MDYQDRQMRFNKQQGTIMHCPGDWHCALSRQCQPRVDLIHSNPMSSQCAQSYSLTLTVGTDGFEWIWQGSKSLGKSAQVMVGLGGREACGYPGAETSRCTGLVFWPGSGSGQVIEALSLVARSEYGALSPVALAGIRVCLVKHQLN